MFAASYLWTLEKRLTQMHQHNWKWGSSLPALQMMGLSRFPHQFQTEVSQCPELILISITVEEESGPFFSFRSCRSSEYLPVAMSYSEMWERRVISADNLFHVSQSAMEEKEHLQHKRLFSLCICIQRCWAFVRPLQLSNIVTAAAMGAKFKGAMDDAHPRYACRAWLPCPGGLNVTHPSLPLAAHRHRLTWCAFYGSYGSVLLWYQWWMTRMSPSSSGSLGSSYISLRRCHLLQVLCYTLPVALRLLVRLDGELGWVKNNLFFCWVIFNSDQFPDPGHHVAARIVMPGCASIFVGWKQMARGGRKPSCGEKLLGAFSELLSRHGVCLHPGSPAGGGPERLCAVWWRHPDSIQSAALCVAGLWFGKAGW